MPVNIGFRPRKYGDKYLPDPSAVPIPPSIDNQRPVQPQAVSGGDTRPGDGYHSGSSAESDGGESIDTAGYRDAQSQSLGLERGQQTPGGIISGLSGIIPGGALFGGYLGDKVDEATGFGGIPEHQRYGSAGTIGTEGGVFNTSGREVDPITGQALNSYGNRNDFYGGSYIQGIKENPFSLSSYLSDPDNAASYTAANQARAAGSRAALGFDAALSRDVGLLGGQDETGTGVTQADRDRVAQHIAVTEHGIQEHSAAPGSATNQAIQGVGYSASGAAPRGSQFSSTGTFSSGNDDNNDHGQNETTQSGSQTSHSGGYGGFADDSATTSGGGSDSGGK